VSDNDANLDPVASRRKARRLALVLGLVALALYVGFILMSVLQASH
jgi:uncharacterized membrane protein (DUF485 family)